MTQQKTSASSFTTPIVAIAGRFQGSSYRDNPSIRHHHHADEEECSADSRVAGGGLGVLVGSPFRCRSSSSGVCRRDERKKTTTTHEYWGDSSGVYGTENQFE